MLDIENRGGIAVIHMRQLTNVLGTELMRRVAAAFAYVLPSRAVVLTGHGDTFAIGGSSAAGVAERTEFAVAERAVIAAVVRHPRPVVAALNGDALDLGFAVAAAADVRVMARGSIGCTRDGTTAGSLTAESVAVIEALAGPERQAVLHDGRTYCAQEALSLALVDEVCSLTGLLDLACAKAEELSTTGRPAGEPGGYRADRRGPTAGALSAPPGEW